MNLYHSCAVMSVHWIKINLKRTHSEDLNQVTFQRIKDFLYPEYDPRT